MQISRSDWSNYIKKLSAVNKKAADVMQRWMDMNPTAEAESVVAVAYTVAEHYGEAAGSLACTMYDAIAEAQGVSVPPALPAQTATYGETAKAVYGTMKNQDNTVAATVGKLVKMVGADTMLQNAERDRAQFAWIPMGDTCAFCLTLASRGWQYMSKKAWKNGHAEHIHANCDCEYAIRFDNYSTVEGYDPDKYLEKYNSFEGKPQEKIKAWRREIREQNKDLVNEQKRIMYRRKNGLQDAGDSVKMVAGAISGALDPNSNRAQEHAERYYEAVRKMTTDCSRIAENTGIEIGDIERIKDFVFNAKHDLGGPELEFFTPSYEMAESWQRLIDGKDIQPHDLTLLQHELMERKLVDSGMTQAEAHERTSQVYNYAKEAKAFYDQTDKHQKK